MPHLGELLLGDVHGDGRAALARLLRRVLLRGDLLL